MFEDTINQLLALMGENLLDLLIGLGILVGGWIVARLVSFLVHRFLKRVKIDERLSGAVSEEEGAPQMQIGRWVSRGVYYIIMLFVLIAFFQTLQLTALSDPLSALLNQLLGALPQLIGALLILLVAWVVASLARLLISRALKMTKFEERISETVELKTEKATVTGSLSQGVFWLVLLLFLPAVLNTLGLQGLVEPVQGVVDSILSGIPDLFGAAILLLVGWFIARVVRQIVTNLLDAANVDRFGERIGLNSKKEPQSLSKIIGTIVYILILIPALIAALNTLNINAISDPAIAMLTTVMSGIPAFFGAAIVLIVAYFVGKLISSLVTNLLTGIGFDTLPDKLGLRIELAEGQKTISEMIGFIVLVATVLLAAIEAADLLGMSFLAEMISNFVSFGGQAILALVVFAIGIYLANLSRNVIMSAGGERASLTANLARIAVLVFVTALSLQQLGIASEIVNLAFGILLGAIGITAALAFGLGAREVAGKQVESWMKNIRSSEEKK